MDINHIQEFIELNECGNFLDAACDLDISQSTLSKHIQSLEKSMGIELFNRTTRKISLSEGGKLFLPYAKQISDTYLDLRSELQEFIARDKIRLSIGCLPVMAHYGIMNVIKEFKQQIPEANINLIEYNAYSGKGICNSLLNFEFELAFCIPPAAEKDKLEIIEYCTDHLIAVLPRTHPLADKKVIDLRLLEYEKFLFLDQTTPLYNQCFAICEEAGFIPDVAFTGVRIENFIELVSNNMGIALLMKHYTTSANKKDIVIREIVPTAHRTIYLVRAANRRHSSISKRFWSYIKTYKDPAI